MKMKAILAIIFVAGITAMVACGSHATSSDAANASGSGTAAGSSAAGDSQAAKADAAATPASTDFGPMRNVEIWDPLFNMVAYTLSIPKSWNFEGTVLHGPGCQNPLAAPVMRVFSPDMLYGIQLLPTPNFFWAEDKQALPHGPACKILQPMSTDDYGKLIAVTARPGAVVDSTELAPGNANFQASLAQSMKYLDQQAAARGYRNQMTAKGEAKWVHIHYDFNGHPEEEILVVALSVTDQPTSVTVSRPGQVLQTAMKPLHVSEPTVTGIRAPKGHLMAHLAAFQAIRNSFKPNPEYLDRYAKFMQDRTNQSIKASWAITNSMLNEGQAEQAQRTANAQAFISNMQKQGDARNAAFAQHEADRSAGVAGFNAQEDARSGHARDVSDYLLDQQLYVNPTTGQTQTQSNQYDHTYSNGSGPGSVVIQANGPNTNPQGVIAGNWTELQPIHH